MEEFSVKRRFDHKKLKAFIFRKRANFFGLLAITVISAIATVILALLHSRRTGILVVVTVLLALLCALQSYKMHSSYRTMPSFRGFRKKKRSQDARA